MADIPADLLPRKVEDKLNRELLPQNALGKDIRKLAGLLDFTIDEINYVHMQKDPFIFFLDQWCKREGKKATLSRLHDALLELGRADMASLIEKTIEDVKKANYTQLQSLAENQCKREERRSKDHFPTAVNPYQDFVDDHGTELKQPPYVYVVYFPENNKHVEQVVQLTNDLRQQQIDAHAAVLEEDTSANDRHFYVFSNLQRADYVLIVCSPAVKNAEKMMTKKERLSGMPDSLKKVAFSLSIMVNDIFNRKGVNAKYIPLFLLQHDVSYVPLALKSAKSYTMPGDFSSLVYRIYGKAELQLPKIVENKTFKPKIVNQ